MEHFVAPLPIRVIGELLGVAAAERDNFKAGVEPVLTDTNAPLRSSLKFNSACHPAWDRYFLVRFRQAVDTDLASAIESTIEFRVRRLLGDSNEQTSSA